MYIIYVLPPYIIIKTVFLWREGAFGLVVLLVTHELMSLLCFIELHIGMMKIEAYLMP